MGRRLACGVLVLLTGCLGDYFDPIDPADHAVVFVPPDTAVYVGGSFQARALMANRFGDVYPSTHIEYDGLDDGVSVSRGGTVGGRALGRARVVALRSELRDTGWVSVVPQGALAVSASGEATFVDLVALDGSGYRRIAPSGEFITGAVAWMPEGSRLVFEHTAGHVPSLHVAGLTGGSAPLFPPPAGVERAQRDPRVSRDGIWIYFAFGDEIWRVHPDGSSLETVTGGSTPLADRQPDPSPDGRRLAFASERLPVGDGAGLVIRDLASGEERGLGVAGSLPRWSPDGSWIAYWHGEPFGNEGALHLIRPDGTGQHTVSPPGRAYWSLGLDWSPDGRWLVARGDSVLELIEVSTGLWLPLPFTAAHTWPSWRP